MGRRRVNTMRFHVTGMTCHHCVRRITDAILRLDLGARVNIDLARGEVRVEGRLEPAAVEAAIRATGYEATATADTPPAVASSCCRAVKA